MNKQINLNYSIFCIRLQYYNILFYFSQLILKYIPSNDVYLIYLLYNKMMKKNMMYQTILYLYKSIVSSYNIYKFETLGICIST